MAARPRGAPFGMTAAILLAVLVLPVVVGGCAQSGGTAAVPAAASGPRPGATVVGLSFVTSYQNVPSAAYYPISGIAGCEYATDGTLIFCDEQRGKVHALDPRRQTWYEFDPTYGRPYTPLDVRIDGFKILVLDNGGARIYRFDLSGALLDVLVDLQELDPGFPVQASAFDIDQDGRMVVADPGSQQVLLLDSFLHLTMRLGDPGTLDDRFTDPSGIVFLRDGSFLVSDRGNRRLSHYGRLGFFEDVVGGEFDRDNPFVAPQGLDRDRFGNVFVADLGAGMIHVLDAGLVPTLSAGADFPLEGALLAPIDVAVGPGDLLAVTDRGRAAVLIYRILYE